MGWALERVVRTRKPYWKEKEELGKCRGTERTQEEELVGLDREWGGRVTSGG